MREHRRGGHASPAVPTGMRWRGGCVRPGRDLLPQAGQTEERGDGGGEAALPHMLPSTTAGRTASDTRGRRRSRAPGASRMGRWAGANHTNHLSHLPPRTRPCESTAPFVVSLYKRQEGRRACVAYHCRKPQHGLHTTRRCAPAPRTLATIVSRPPGLSRPCRCCDVAPQVRAPPSRPPGLPAQEARAPLPREEKQNTMAGSP